MRKSARKNNKLSKDSFLIVNAGISSRFTVITHKWQVGMVSSQLLAHKLRIPTQHYGEKASSPSV